MLGPRLLAQATFGLERKQPQFSARHVITRAQACWGLGLLVPVLMLVVLRPGSGSALLTAAVAVGYIANAVFRAWLFWVGSDLEKAPGEHPSDCDADLPVYTILIPLYREANLIPQIAEALAAIDYPGDLDVKLVTEADDFETVAAIEAAALPWECLHVPASEPRTKPKACNYALPFARGEFLVIYDAEDRPEPDQLKKAVAAFRNGPPDVACLQARLNFFNAKETRFLTRMFALDYGLWFDYLLPGLDRLQIPMPLGGTSNHFRTAALRAIHGWDPFNVTEDADIGIRLAQRGFRVKTLDSTTYEEATTRFGNWLRQRTRWMKGYMQTWLVHMRDPAALVRNAGWGGFLGFQLFVGGTVLSALLNPILWLTFMATILFVPGSAAAHATMETMSVAGIVLGNALFAYLAMLGPYRRGWLELSPYGLLVPFYWLLISVAAYRGLWQLVRNPWHWEKTAHGLTRMQPAAHVR